MHRKNGNAKYLGHSHYENDSRGFPSSNDYSNSDAFESKKKRIMNYKLIQVEGLPKELASIKTLSSKTFFGRYGSILCILLKDKDQEGRLLQTANAYITYESEINSSLALLGAHNTVYKETKISVYFGTNKYCHNFLMHVPCDKKCCYYLHKLDTQNQCHKAEHLKQRHLDRAFSFIVGNLNRVISMQIDEKRGSGSPQACLRSIEAILQRMIRKGKLSAQQYDKAKSRGKVASEKIVLLLKHPHESTAPEIFTSGLNMQAHQTPSKDLVVKHALHQNLAYSLQICPSSTPVQTSEGGLVADKLQVQRGHGDENLNNIIVAKILKQLSKKRGLSRLQLDQADRLRANQMVSMPEDEQTRTMREKITRCLLQG